MRMRSLMTQAPSRNPSSVLKRPLNQHHLGCITLGQSVLVPYQLSASSYATAGNEDMLAAHQIILKLHRSTIQWHINVHHKLCTAIITLPILQLNICKL